VAGLSIVSRWGGRAAESLFALLFPSDGRICGTPLVMISRLPVCDECLASMHPIAGCACSVCGERILFPYAVSGIDGEPRCRLCRSIQLPFAQAVAYGSHEGGLRGFHQAELIARAALKLQPSPGGLRLLEGVLERKRDTCPQTGLTSYQRRENMRGAFTVVRPEEVKGRPLLVVDEVYTTGANVSECARVLHRAQHLKYGSPRWRGRSRYRHAKWKSCDVRKAMTRLSRWRKRPEAKQRGVRRTFVSRNAVRLR
jgi:predicted amidophosphoribosyltransferase